jgi:hypothetical protein
MSVTQYPSSEPHPANEFNLISFLTLLKYGVKMNRIEFKNHWSNFQESGLSQSVFAASPSPGFREF